jgi:lactoylglutathione lyase
MQNSHKNPYNERYYYKGFITLRPLHKYEQSSKRHFSPSRQNLQIGTGFGHIAINVADVSQAVEVAKQLGVEVIRDAGPMNAGETMVAFLKDPDGYEIELLCAEVASCWCPY